MRVGNCRVICYTFKTTQGTFEIRIPRKGGTGVHSPLRRLSSLTIPQHSLNINIISTLVRPPKTCHLTIDSTYSKPLTMTSTNLIEEWGVPGYNAPQKSILTPCHTSFPQFTRLLPEIRAKIWALLLPPPRVISIKQIWKSISAQNSTTIPTRFGVTLKSTPTANGAVVEKAYRACPISYGGKQPILLSICKESHEEALRSLTLRFETYWNFEQDYLYVEARPYTSENTLGYMRKEGLLAEVKNLAFDHMMFQKKIPEPMFVLHLVITCLTANNSRATSLRLLPQVSNIALIFQKQEQAYHIDILDPGVSWYLLEQDSPEQTEFSASEWCELMKKFRDEADKVLKVDLVENSAGWNEWGSAAGYVDCTDDSKLYSLTFMVSMPRVKGMMLGGRKSAPRPGDPEWWRMDHPLL